MSVVVITGCSSGFGMEAALAFARNGDRVYATMRDPGKGTALLNAAGSSRSAIEIQRLDVTRPQTFAPLFKQIVDREGGIDVLVNNAGITRAGALEDTPESALRQIMETNLFGPLLLTQAVLPVMRKQASGHIIMISSLSGVAGLPGDVPYSASKFAIEGATEALRHEVDRWNIRVALVEAGLYATQIFESVLPEDSLLPPDYPNESPYRPLIEQRMAEVRERLPQAFDPRIVGELLVDIVSSESDQLRWPADDVAKKVLGTLFAHDDDGRDQFLRDVAGTQWWSGGEAAPSSGKS